MSSSTNIEVFPEVLISGAFGIFIALLDYNDLLEIRQTYTALTLVLIVFLLVQVIRIRRRHPQRWLLNPAILCAFQTFLMGYGITNFIFNLPKEKIASAGWETEVFPAMVTHQYLVLLGALVLYLGYWSPVARRLVNPLAVERFKRSYLPDTDRLNVLTVPILFGISVFARLFAISQGLYGYGGDYSAERLVSASAFSQYLSMAGSLGKLALLLASLEYYAKGIKRSGRYWFWIALVFEVFFGFLSGMKSAVGMPLVVVGVAYYLQRGKIPKRWILMTILSISVAYAVIEPFRHARNSGDVSLTSIRQILSVLEEGLKIGEANYQDNQSTSTIFKIAARSNISYIGAYGLDFADMNKPLPPGSPAFLEDILLAPLHAVVPRFIWNSKPLGNLGLWYNQEVMGASHFSSTAMGPFTYLYFAGGYLAVAIFFYVFGILLRVLWFRLTPWQSLPGATIMLGISGGLASIDSAVNGIIISLIRDGLLLTLLTHLMFQRRSVSVIPRLTLPP